MLPVLLPVREDSNISLEVLRLGSESAARRAENFHANIPSTWIDSGCEAPSQEWHPPGRRESPALYAPTTQQPRNTDATNAHHAASAADCRHPKPPGLGVGVLLITSFAIRQTDICGHRTNTEQIPNTHRTKTGKGQRTSAFMRCVRMRKQARNMRASPIFVPSMMLISFWLRHFAWSDPLFSLPSVRPLFGKWVSRIPSRLRKDTNSPLNV